MKRSLLTISTLVCFFLFTNGQVINIPADFSTIQEGIDAANDGDSVLVAENTYYENINYNGKAITVASRYILDGDTSHISKTIIDGSQFSHRDSACTVTMCSGEDTTSVLTGFTITGGEGSMVSAYWGKEIIKDFAGGGVAIVNAGGKICDNIIQENHLVNSDNRAGGYTYAGGIYANVNHNHTAIIRNNLIRNNTLTGPSCYAAGVFLVGGRIILEDNTIIDNVMYAHQWAIGTAIYWANWESEGVIHEVIFRNNVIARNNGNTSIDADYGGTVIMGGRIGNERVQFYNNVVNDNYNDGYGGGFIMLGTSATLINNTIWNNKAKRDGNNLALWGGNDDLMFNNIIWSDEANGNADIYFKPDGESSISAFNNILLTPLESGDGLTASNNLYDKPIFQSGSFALAENSPGIGRGIDSAQIGGDWYYAPSIDFKGNIRPHTIDNLTDLGAIESPYEGFINIPNTALLRALIDAGVDTNGDSLISYDEAALVVSLNLDTWGVADFTGLEAFKNLDSLDIFGSFGSLSFSENASLRYLKLWWFDCYPPGTLTNLNLTGNTLLETLIINGLNLSQLDVSSNTKLTHLDCRCNQLEELDLSNNTALKELKCVRNGIASLNLMYNESLERLDCGANSLSELNLTNNHELLYLSCGGNQLTQLDVSGNYKLRELDCGDNMLTYLNLSNNSSIEVLGIGGMTSLYEVCVWDLFSSETTEIYDEGSPNINFKDCLAPAITATDSLYQPFSMEVISSEDGVIYCVPEGTDKDLATIRGVCADSSEAMANTNVEIQLTDLTNGEYWLYASDKTGNISEPWSFMVHGVGIKRLASSQIRIYPNPAQHLLNIETDRIGFYSIEITSLNGKLILSKEKAGPDFQVDISSFREGIYFVTIRSKDAIITRKIIKY